MIVGYSNFPFGMVTFQGQAVNCGKIEGILYPGRLTWNITMEVWKIMFLSKWLISRFHVNLPGCNRGENYFF